MIEADAPQPQAQRWAARCPFCRNHPGEDIRDGMVIDCPDCAGAGRVTPDMRAYEDGVRSAMIKPLAEGELAGLLAWVRACMAEADAKVRRSKAEIDARRAAKGMDPTSRISADRDGLVLSVAVQLDLIPHSGQFGDKELRPAQKLCELAGFPDCNMDIARRNDNAGDTEQ